MSNYKGVSIDWIRASVREKGLEDQVIAGLPDDVVETYQTALPVSWIPVEHGAQILDAMARTLHPGVPDANQRLGRDAALHDMTGIYRVLLKVATIPKVIQSASRLWSNYHREGRAHAGRDGAVNRGWLIVEDYPRLPTAIRENTSGYIAGLLDMTRARNPQVVHDASTPSAWRWTVTWD